MKRWELALLLGAAAAILWCAASGGRETALLSWWSVAFEPLCDGILTEELGGGGIVLRSRLWELLMGLLR